MWEGFFRTLKYVEYKCQGNEWWNWVTLLPSITNYMQYYVTKLRNEMSWNILWEFFIENCDMCILNMGTPKIWISNIMLLTNHIIQTHIVDCVSVFILRNIITCITNIIAYSKHNVNIVKNKIFVKIVTNIKGNKSWYTYIRDIHTHFTININNCSDIQFRDIVLCILISHLPNFTTFKRLQFQNCLKSFRMWFELLFLKRFPCLQYFR